MGGIPFGHEFERMETENRGVCGRTWRAGTFSDFLPGFFGADIPNHQRFATNRVVPSASGADVIVCVHGGARFGAGLRGVVFHCAKGRGSAVSQQGRKAFTRHSSLGGTERFLGMLVAALLPPPTPFKFFVFAAGVFEVPLFSYTSAITIARLFRYFGIGYLAIRYGADAIPYLMHHKLQVTVLVISLVIVSYVLSRMLLRRRTPSEKTNRPPQVPPI